MTPTRPTMSATESANSGGMLLTESAVSDVSTTTPDAGRWLVLGVVCIATYAVLVDTSIVNVALPTLVRELDATTTELKWIVDAYNLAFASWYASAAASVTGSVASRRS